MEDLLDNQKEYERIDTFLHVLAATIDIASMVFSTLSGIHYEYLSYAALGCSKSAVFSGAIKAMILQP